MGRRSGGRSRPPGDGEADDDRVRIVRACELQVDGEHDPVGTDHHCHDHAGHDATDDRYDHSEYYFDDHRTHSDDDRDRSLDQLH